jgi:hypothetical protein
MSRWDARRREGEERRGSDRMRKILKERGLLKDEGSSAALLGIRQCLCFFSVVWVIELIDRD